MAPLPVFHTHQHPITYGIWLATCIAWVAPEAIASRRLRSAKDAEKADRGSMAAVYIGLYAGIILGFRAAVLAPRFGMWEHWRAFFALGIAVWLFGIALRWYSIRTLGRFFTFDVAISKGQHVVDRGPYRWVRHPSYLGSLLSTIGLGLTLSNWLAMLLPPLCLFAAYLYRIPVEERALVCGLGPAYRDYMRRTWRLVPYLF